MKDMHILVINLEKNKERMAFMDRQLKAFDLDYERIPAVYGAALTKDERKKCFARFHSFLAMGVKLNDGEIGCSLSHLLCCRRILSEGWDGALILEDDAALEPGFDRTADSIRSVRAKGRPQVFILSCIGGSHIQNDTPSVERIGGAMGTEGYWISREAAEIIVRANDPVVTVADKWNRWVGRYGLELYRVWPTTVWQDNATFGTEINTWRRKRPTGLRWIFRKVCRVPEVFLDWLWFKVTGQ